MQWIVITADDLKVGKAAALLDAYATAALGSTQPDPTAEVIAAASERIRTEIQSCSRNKVSATTNAIPPSLKSLAIRLICWELNSRLNVLNALQPSDQDKDDHRDDLRYLERIAKCEVAIETPDDPLPTPDVQSGGPTAEAVGTRPKQSTRESMSGL